MLGVVLTSLPDDPVAVRATDDHEPFEPTRKLAGLSLVLRAVLTLQKEGIARVVLLVPADRPDLLEHVRRDRRVRIEVTARPFEAREPPWRVLGAAAEEPFVLARSDRLVDPIVYRKLVHAASFDAGLGFVASLDGRLVGPLAGSEGLAAALSGRRTLEELVARGDVTRLELEGAWTADARTAAGRHDAVLHLFEACRKPLDGIVARHLNRHVSLFVSKRLVDTSITPNQATVATFLVGLLGAGLATRGGYLCTLLAALLMQLGSILDGVDGELARVRFQQSKLGQWLDTIGDDASNALYYAGLTIGLGSFARHPVLAVSGCVATAATVLASAVYYAELVRLGSGDLYAIEWSFDKGPSRTIGMRVVSAFRLALKQDFFLFAFFVMALVGVLPYALPLIALGAVVTAVAAAGRTMKLWGTASRGPEAVSAPARDSRPRPRAAP